VIKGEVRAKGYSEEEIDYRKRVKTIVNTDEFTYNEFN